MKKKAIVWGTGGKARQIYTQRVLYNEFEIIAFADNNPNLWNTKFNNHEILSPQEVTNMEYDCILIWSTQVEAITRQLTDKLHVDRWRIYSYHDLEKRLCDNLIEKYRDSSDSQLRKVLNYYRNKGFNIFGYYEGEKGIEYLVKRDSEGWPFIIFEGKKMYYPKDYIFAKQDGMDCVYDVLYEQGYGSPHKYIRTDSDITEKGVIVDAGVCEGNFALRYVDKAKKIYLIESDPRWMSALGRTFERYKDKVVLCQRFLTRYDSSNTITLDTLVSEDIDFLKMDIEGAEVDALIGGKRVLQRSNATCAICSYHKQYDAENIGWIMNNLGYKTSESEGYMFFSHDEDISDTMDFRKGIVYADKVK